MNNTENKTKTQFDYKGYATFGHKELKHCVLCNKDISYYSMSKHMKSKKHIERMNNTSKERKQIYSELKEIINNIATLSKDDLENALNKVFAH